MNWIGQSIWQIIAIVCLLAAHSSLHSDAQIVRVVGTGVMGGIAWAIVSILHEE